MTYEDQELFKEARLARTGNQKKSLPPKVVSGFTVGICATGEARNLPHLIREIREDSWDDNFSLEQVIIIASDCSRSTLKSCRDLVSADRRFAIVEEKYRTGKSVAISRIVEMARGEFLLFINADASPQPGSISKLLNTISKSETNGVVSACPNFPYRGNMLSSVEQLMWGVHNECSHTLNHLSLSNHASDEMIIVRSKILKPESLPSGLVNDGAFIAGVAKMMGFSIKFCPNAGVTIDVPPTMLDLIQQRRRILFGHFQIRKFVGKSPKTVESLALSSPSLSIRIVLDALRKKPRLLAALPIAFASEMISFVLAVFDSSTSSKKHQVWKRYGN